MNAKQISIAAIDLGAESGRVMLAQFDGARITLREAHRFANVTVNANGTLHWDILRLFADIKLGLRAAAQLADGTLDSIGIDTWGVDFALLDAQDALIGNPVCYRDARTNGMLARVGAQLGRERIFARTGIQFIQINTLYQLAAMVEQRSPQLDIARSFLMVPDLLNFWLCGAKANEYTDASTTQMLDVHSRDWARDLIRDIGAPTHIFGNVISPGTRLGALRKDVADEIGIAPTPVIAPATHDTASAVVAAPLSARDAIYISSGTWSLMGIESQQAMVGASALSANMTNEGGVDGTYRVLKNIMGLWLLQECRRDWAAHGRSYDYAQLEAMARAAKTTARIDASDERFLAPRDMPARIQQFCVESGQPVPQSDAEIARCVLESLAAEYARVAAQLDTLSGARASAIHIVGGGAQNTLLNQLTANTTQRTVYAGPFEVTALGNALMQLRALGAINTLDDARDLVRRNFDVRVFEPEA
jgi:rhamnulokinase